MRRSTRSKTILINPDDLKDIRSANNVIANETQLPLQPNDSIIKNINDIELTPPSATNKHTYKSIVAPSDIDDNHKSPIISVNSGCKDTTTNELTDSSIKALSTMKHNCKNNNISVNEVEKDDVTTNTDYNSTPTPTSIITTSPNIDLIKPCLTAIRKNSCEYMPDYIKERNYNFDSLLAFWQNN